MAVAELESRGWHFNSDKITALLNDETGNLDNITKRILDIDLKDIGTALLSEDINEGRVDRIKTPCVLQLQNLRVVSAPRDAEAGEESLAGPKICRLSLTDGHTACSAVTLETVTGLNQSTLPGSKLLLSGDVEVQSKFLLLTTKNTIFLGGQVSDLADTLEVKKDVEDSTCSETGASREGKKGPPPFVPFEEKISADLLPPREKDNFKSLGRPKERKIPEGEAEFQQFRQAAVKEALQVRYARGRVPAPIGGQCLASIRGPETNCGSGEYRMGAGHRGGNYSSRRDGFFDLQNNPSLALGTPCLARYSQDGQFYQAIVSALALDGYHLITFVHYGSQEIVHIRDIQPLPDLVFQGPGLAHGPSCSSAPFSWAPQLMPPVPFAGGGGYYNSGYGDGSGYNTGSYGGGNSSGGYYRGGYRGSGSCRGGDYYGGGYRDDGYNSGSYGGGGYSRNSFRGDARSSDRSRGRRSHNDQRRPAQEHYHPRGQRPC